MALLKRSTTSFLRFGQAFGGVALLLPLAAHADCTTVAVTTTCDTDAPNPWTTTVGTGNVVAADNRIVDVQAGGQIAVGNANAISLRDNANIHVGSGSTVSATSTGAGGLFGTGNNTIEIRNNGTLTVDAGGQVLALGTQSNAEAINFQGPGNVVNNSGTIRATNSVAIWSQNTTGLNTVINTETGVIQATGTVIGGSGNGALDFTNRGMVIGNLTLAGGNDILRLFTGSTITGNFSGGDGSDVIFLSGTGDSTLPGNFVGFEALTKNDSGKWTLSGTITGVTVATVAQGTLALTGNNANYTGQVIVNSAGILEARAQSLPPTVTDNGLVRFTQADDGTYAGAITGSGSLEKTGAGTLTLSGTMSVARGTALQAGKVIAASTLETSAVTMNDGTTLQIDGTLRQQGGAAANVVGASGAQTLIVNGTLTGSALLGDGDDVLDVSGTIGGSVDQGDGNDSAFLRSNGSIVGTLAQGSGNDRLEMLGGSIGSAVTQGDGDDVLLMGSGNLLSVDQGNGVDRAEISGGAVTGNIQQGNGTDTFTMSGGQIGSLSQGDSLDTFTMSDGRIVGAFEDGDNATMTGGRIGRVDMKLDNNVFNMSGGTIDGNLVTAFGNDTVIVSGTSYIGGNISVSGGTDRVTVTGGTVRGEVRMSAGTDTFIWDSGGVIYGPVDLGIDNDTALLRNLTVANLGAMPVLTGGTGVDSLTFENVSTNGVARFQNLETVNAHNDTELTFDGNLTLGDSASGTGSLNVDATSTLFGGGTNAAALPFVAGQLVNVTNAGRIDLTNGSDSTGDSFTIAGNYQGDSALLLLQSQLGDDSSPSDKLILSGGHASGMTGIGVFNVGGSGAATMVDGILVVEAINGATTNTFALDGTVAAGAFEYFLFKGGVSAGTSENWYLRSALVTVPGALEPPPAPAPAPDPVEPQAPPEPVAPEPLAPPPPPLSPATPLPPEGVDPPVVPPDQAEPPPPAPPPAPSPAQPPSPPPAPSELPTEPAPVPVPGLPLPTPPTPGAIAATGNVILLYRVETPTYSALPPVAHELRLASLGTFHERQGEQALLQGEGGVPAAWGRAIGQNTEQSWRGTVAPTFDGSLWGVQVGLDLFARETESGQRDRFGVFLGQTSADGDVRGFAVGWFNLSVGDLDLKDKHLGLYWTHMGPSGAYVDAVLMGDRLDGDATSRRGIGIDLEGDGASASVEVGYPLAFTSTSTWRLEPQAQLIWQHVSFDDQGDRFARISFDSDDALIGRIGLRLVSDYDTARGLLQPYLKLNLWHGFGGEDRIAFDTTVISTEQAFNAVEFGGGLVARVNEHVGLYLVADYTVDMGDDGEDRETVEGNLGVRVTW